MASGKLDKPIIIKKHTHASQGGSGGFTVIYDIVNIDGYVPISVFFEQHSGVSPYFTQILYFENSTPQRWRVLLDDVYGSGSWTPTIYYVVYVRKDWAGIPEEV